MTRTLIVAAVLAVACGGTHAAEQQAAAGTGRSAPETVVSRLEVPGVRGHVLQQATGAHELQSPDPVAGVSLAGARLETRSQADLVDGLGLVRGYGILETKAGDRIHVVYGYRVGDGEGEGRAIEGTFEWRGGTGSFDGIRGAGSLHGKLDDEGRATYRWEVSYRVLLGEGR